MRKLGFDNEKYLAMQSDHIRQRISQFGDKLYLEFVGKLFDDYHASRVLPGFEPDSKLRMLMQLADQAEIIMAILLRIKYVMTWESPTMWMCSVSSAYSLTSVFMWEVLLSHTTLMFRLLHSLRTSWKIWA